MQNSHNNSEYLVGQYIVDPLKSTIRDSQGQCSNLSQLTLALLMKLIEHAPDVVSNSEIIHSVWNNRHVSDETLQQRIKLLRQALNDNPSAPEYICTVRNKGYKLIAPVSQRTVSEQKPPEINKLWKLSAIFFAILTMVFLAILLSKSDTPVSTVNPSESAHINQNRILVLPLKSLNKDEKNVIFAKGLSRQLALALSYIEKIDLRSDEDFSQYDLTHKNPLQLAKDQDSAYVIFGDVDRVGETIKVHIAMQHSGSENYFWSKTVSVEFKDIFKTQNQLVQEIADSLNLRFNPVSPKMLAQPTHNISAYDYMLKADKYLRRMQKVDNEISIDLSRKAIELDPKLALAHYTLGLAYLLQQSNWNGELALIDKAIDEANTVIRINPDLSEGYFLLGLSYRYKGWHFPGDWSEKGIAAYEKALEVNPNNVNAKNALIDYYFRYKKFGRVLEVLYESLQNYPESVFIHQKIGSLFEDLNYNDIAIQWYKKGLELRPDNYSLMMDLSEIYQSLGQYDLAMHYVDEILKRYPQQSNYLFQKADIHLFMGEWAEAEKYISKGFESLPAEYTMEKGYYLGTYINLSFIYKQTNRPHLAQSLLEKLPEIIQSEMKSYPEFDDEYLSDLALIEVLKNDSKNALKLLSDAVDAGFISDDWLQHHPVFQDLKNRGFLNDILARINKTTEEYRSQIQESGILKEDLMQLDNKIFNP